MFSTIKISLKVEAAQVSITGEWINKMQHIHIMTYLYLKYLKRKELLTHATTWIHPEDCMLCEMSQAHKDKYQGTPLSEITSVVQFMAQKVEWRSPGTGEVVGGEQGVDVEKAQCFKWEDGKVLEMDGGDVQQQCE